MSCLRLLLGYLFLPTELIELWQQHAKAIARAIGMRQLLSQGESFVAPLQGLVRIAKIPQGQSHDGSGKHSRVNAHKEKHENGAV